MEIDCVIVDCVDPERLADFWGQVLGREVGRRLGPYVFLERKHGLGVGFQRAEGAPKAGKNRLHLDVEAADPLAEARRVESLGGRRAEGFEAGGFLVMLDPEGNEFCIIPEEPLEMDEEGRVDYLGRRGGRSFRPPGELPVAPRDGVSEPDARERRTRCWCVVKSRKCLAKPHW